MMETLQEKLEQKKQVITAEITPPKGSGVKKLMEHAKMLGPRVDAINVTDCQRALVKMSSLASCKLLLDAGIEPVFQLTCRDRNSIALQSDLLGASALGIRNVLCLTGDPVKVGDSPESKAVFEMESVRLLETLGKLQTGRDSMGLKLNKKTQFFPGGVVSPKPDSAITFKRMDKKIDAGARFFQTQASYDLDEFEAFFRKTADKPASFLAGILILPSFRVASFIHENIPGIKIPEEVLERFKKAQVDKNEVQEGIRFAAETMARVAPFCQGFHLMSVRTEELIVEVMDYYAKHYT